MEGVQADAGRMIATRIIQVLTLRRFVRRGPAMGALLHAAAMRQPPLVDASRGGGVRWQPGEGRPQLATVPGGIRVFRSAGRDAGADQLEVDTDVIPETQELPEQLARALFEGPTLWVDHRPAGNGTATFAAPLPPEDIAARLRAALDAG